MESAAPAAVPDSVERIEKSVKLAVRRSEHKVEACRTGLEASESASSTATATYYPPSYLVSQLKKITAPTKKIPASSLILQSGQQISLALGVMWIGRDPINDICLGDDPAVGRSQAAISWENNEYWIANQDNACIMRLNGKPMNAKSKIYSGDVIDVGGTKILVR